MMEGIKNTFRNQVSHYEWIDDQTRPKIYEKVGIVKVIYKAVDN